MTYKRKIDNLILNYLIQEGYKEAAVTFAKETNIDISKESKPCVLDAQSIAFLATLNKVDDEEFFNVINSHEFQSDIVPTSTNGNFRIVRGYTTINERTEIKYLILRGEVNIAIEKISEYFPTVLDSNNLLHFKLLRLSLIEMIRNHKLTHQDSASDIEKKFLGDILTFVRNNLINKVTKSFKLLKELEITMSLLCFNFDPQVTSIDEQKDLPDELRSLFDLSLRTQCYRLVNKAILDLNDDTNENELEDIEGDQRHFDKLRYRTKVDYDFSKIDKDEIQRYSKDLSIGNGTAELDELNDNTSIDDAPEVSSDEESCKLSDLALDSKLERIVKLWSVTEDRVNELMK